MFSGRAWNASCGFRFLRLLLGEYDLGTRFELLIVPVVDREANALGSGAKGEDVISQSFHREPVFAVDFLAEGGEIGKAIFVLEGVDLPK